MARHQPRPQSISAVIAEDHGLVWLFRPNNSETQQIMSENFRHSWHNAGMAVDVKDVGRVFRTLRDLGIRVKGIS